MVFTKQKLKHPILLTDSLVGVVRLRMQVRQKGGMSMTSNQIGLANFRETVKHNRQTELENRRHNTATETLTGRQTEENIRHNIASEGISRDTVAESRRHNVSTEGINWYSAQALAGLQSAQAKLAESDIGVKARTADITQQGNLLNYDVQSRQAGASEKQASASQQNASTASHNLEFNREQFQWNKQVDKAQATQAAVNNATNAITSVFGSVTRIPGENWDVPQSTQSQSNPISQRYYRNVLNNSN